VFRAPSVSFAFIATALRDAFTSNAAWSAVALSPFAPRSARSLLRPVQRALRGAELTAEEIDEWCWWVGGTAMRWFQEMVRTLIRRSPASPSIPMRWCDWCRRSGPASHLESSGTDAQRVFAFALASKRSAGDERF